MEIINVYTSRLESQVDNNQQKLFNNKLIVFAEFNNGDEEGHLRLNPIGTMDDLVNQNMELQDGKIMTFYSEHLEVDGIIKHSQEENIWVAIIN
ncbi:hypothetical protein [Trichormus azollae]|jgi:hypothetical protein|uniref:Uncharacterized protein n=1 Tax=Nostoc azollae (strain 0708) TaxID=551115 RepID=D7E1J3_NOSA0|nr:hypothetical protein [Trichormus azollae]ADI63220.1 hypothetical protein Aazo_0792 ['Nostoc azollae' 0708]